MGLDDEVKLKKQHDLFYHPVDFVDYMSQTLAMVDSFTDFDHFFEKSELFMILLRRVNHWLLTGADGNSTEPRYNGKFPTQMPQPEYDHIFKLWRGEGNGRGAVWRVMKLIEVENEFGEIEIDIDVSQSYFSYVKPLHLDENQWRVRRLPPLQDLLPKSQIKDKTELGVKIRTHVPLADAHFGQDFATLITNGFSWKFVNETRGYFKDDQEILNSKQLVDYVSNDYFHTVIDLLTEEFEVNETPLYMFIQGLIKLIKSGHGNLEEESEEAKPYEVIIPI